MSESRAISLPLRHKKARAYSCMDALIPDENPTLFASWFDGQIVRCSRGNKVGKCLLGRMTMNHHIHAIYDPSTFLKKMQ